ncbi:EthD family reductase [Nioella ostreopsis]|uniref:EthD family reductase n=1 Tax=Nioella ostreopsis TaxID=2448479 RepID=UPI000FDB5BCD|nr:EthD family reductase [Nioella ostreopsis]
MAMTVQVIYPTGEGKTFDYDYYVETHLPMVGKVMGPHGLADAMVSKGLAGGPDAPPGYFAVATLMFPDEATMKAGLGAAGPLLEDIPNFTNVQPDMLIGTTL